MKTIKYLTLRLMAVAAIAIAFALPAKAQVTPFTYFNVDWHLTPQENDASIILEDKTFQNPSSVSCLEGIPDFRSLPSLPLLPKFKV